MDIMNAGRQQCRMCGGSCDGRGAELSRTSNRNLAADAQQLGLGMMLGSQRIMDSAPGERAAESSMVREMAPELREAVQHNGDTDFWGLSKLRDVDLIGIH